MNTNPDKPTSLDWVFRVLGFLILTVIAFNIPAYPGLGLDESWRMTLGKFFLEGRQFGTEIVFTYGPLGFIMGNTYWGGQWDSLNAWHLLLGLCFVSVVYMHAFRLTGYRRLCYLLFFFLVGLTYQDSTQQIIIALAGLELIRRSDKPWQWSSLALILLLTLLSLIKFTNIILSVALVILSCALSYWSLRRALPALRNLLIYFAAFQIGWILCGQHITNLPSYFYSSWQISHGYEAAMGVSCPAYQLYLGLSVLGLTIAYTLINLLTAADKVRGLALSIGVGAFIYLNWKHGFIRADGHQIGFYYAALAVAVSAKILLEENSRFIRFKQSLLVSIGIISVVALDLVLPGLSRGVLGNAQALFHKNLSHLTTPGENRVHHDERLQGEKAFVDLINTRARVGDASIDVLGYEQAVAVLNDFNYQPRPVFQGYSAYTDYLSRLNYDYFASDEAPEYVLFKLQSIDGRLATMDDPHVLRLLIQRYTYLFTELGYTLWQRKPDTFDADTYEPKFIRSLTAAPGEKIDISDLTDQHVWVEIDYQFNLLGRLRSFFFKPALVQLRITDQKGTETLHRLPQTIGEAGFMLNPVINDMLDFMRAAGGEPKRRATSIIIETAPQNLDCLKNDIQVSFSSMPPSQAGTKFFEASDKALFHMFVHTPVYHKSLNAPNEDEIDRRRVMVLHAPSKMVFDVPSGAREITGYFGFVPGAYTNGGSTNGAGFTIVWSDGLSEPTIIYERFLDPMTKLNDRGLQKFSVAIPQSRGQVILQVDSGPYGEYAFDWTGWSGIEFK